jgi:hypothetical protein
MDLQDPYSADDARREIAEALDRADDLGQAIATQLAEAERELEEIKRSEAVASAWQARPTRS